jgi:enoyl-CoA hydratase
MTVQFDVDGHVGIITINRPESRNAINDVVAKGIEAAIDRIENDDSIRVGILTGAPPVFSAGADLKMVDQGRGPELSTERGGFGGLVWRERTKPLIAAVDGPALAGGTELVLACDLVVASNAAKFGVPEVKRSLVAAAGGLFRLPRKIPMNLAMECVLTGDPISAERATEFGLVNRLCEPGTALTAAIDLANRIAVNAPVAVRESRRIVLGSLGQDDGRGWELSREGLDRAFASEDFKEGVRAFIEKRSPQWVGR